MAFIADDIQQLYNRLFGGRPVIPARQPGGADEGGGYLLPAAAVPGNLSPQGRVLFEQYQGREVWLPVRLYAYFGRADGVLELPYSVVRVQSKKQIISTPLLDRRGAVKELYSIDDWHITVKGFIIGTNRQWPEAEIARLVDFYTKPQSLVIENALTDLLLENDAAPAEQCRVVMESLELPEMEGGRTRIQAFSMKLLSDTIFTLDDTE